MSIIEKNSEFLKELHILSGTVGALKQLWEEGHSYNSPKVYTAAMDVLDQAEAVVAKLEALDDNLDIENHSHPDMDSLFKDNPVTDFVDARINFAMGDESEENLNRMKAAAEKISEAYEDDAVMECTCDEYEDCSECPLPLFELYEIVSSLDEEYSEEVAGAMDLIEIHLHDKESFDEKDTEMIRFYLRNLPTNSHMDIEELSDRAVQLAFKTRMMNLGKL
jgi:hypothetical protein